MDNRYVTDPQLIERLNQASSNDYVTDPNLIEKLNKLSPQAQPSPPQQKEEMVGTFLGNMPRHQPMDKEKTQEQIRQMLDVYGFMGPGAMLRAPQVVSNVISKLPRAMQGLTNMLGRIGTGTAMTTGSEYFSPQNKENLGDIASKNALLNTALEIGTLPFRIPAHVAEVFNPLKYASHKANQIKNEFSATSAVNEANYKPINDRYNDYTVTVTPEKYLADIGITRKGLHPDAKIIYDDFVSNPVYKNLQRFKTKMGNEWARTSGFPAFKAKSERFKNNWDMLNKKTENFLSKDPEALSQYKLATDYARDQYFPYLATPTLKKISKGKLDVPPGQLARSIKKGTEKTVGQEERNLIPKGHPLHGHLKDINNALNFGNAAQFAIPAGLGVIGGELLHPGLGGAVGGGISGIGGAGLSKIASKFGGPTMTNFMQNPMIENIFKKTSPPYYAIGREEIARRGGE